MSISVNRTRGATPEQNYARQPSPGQAGPRRVQMPPGSSVQAQQFLALQQQVSLISRVVLDLRGQVKQLMAMAGVKPAPQPQYARPPPPAAGNRPAPQQPSRPQAVPAAEQTVEAEAQYERGSDEDLQAMRRYAAGGLSAEEAFYGGEED